MLITIFFVIKIGFSDNKNFGNAKSYAFWTKNSENESIEVKVRSRYLLYLFDLYKYSVDKSYAIKKQLKIHSTLTENATELIPIIIQAGSSLRKTIR